MKTISSQMNTHLQQEVTSLCTCWKIKREDGEIFGFTDHDQDLVISGLTYIAQTGYMRTAISNSASLAVDELQADGILDDDAITEDDLRLGKFDFAEVTLFAVNWADLTQGPVNLRYGIFGEVTIQSSGRYSVELRGLAQLMQTNVGDTFMPECRVDLGSNKCGIALIPDHRRAGKYYAVGDRVRIPSDVSERIFELPVINPDFGDYASSETLYWTFANALITSSALSGTLNGVKTSGWDGYIRQDVILSDYFGITDMTGATGTLSVKAECPSIYQQTRLFVQFLDGLGAQIDFAATSYASVKQQLATISLAITIPAGTVSVVAQIQFRQYKDKDFNDGELFKAIVHATTYDNASLLLSATECLVDGSFDASASLVSESIGWTSVTVRTQFDGLFADDGGHFATGTSFYTTAALTLEGGGVTVSEIDAGSTELVVDWLQANADINGKGGVQVRFYTGAGATISTITAEEEVMTPSLLWLPRQRVVTIPATARSVRFFGISSAYNSVVYGSTPKVGFDKFQARVQLIDGDLGGMNRFGGVEYECTNRGTTANASLSGVTNTVGATFTDGGVTWQVKNPNWTFLATVESVTNRRNFTVTGNGLSSKEDQWFKWGVCKFLTGANADRAIEIAQWTQATRTTKTLFPLPVQPEVGDLCVISVGCNKSIKICKEKFDNILNFRGEPFVPGTDHYFKVGAPTT